MVDFFTKTLFKVPKINPAKRVALKPPRPSIIMYDFIPLKKSVGISRV